MRIGRCLGTRVIIVMTAFGEQNSVGEIGKKYLGPSSMVSADEYYECVEQCIALPTKELNPGEGRAYFEKAKA